MGYLAPEYLFSGKASDKTDVFSFGAVVLEVACGRELLRQIRDLERAIWLIGFGVCIEMGSFLRPQT